VQNGAEEAISKARKCNLGPFTQVLPRSFTGQPSARTR
jgi:hypothetical protein